MYPHERSLVKRFYGRPFVLLGVNSDEDPEELKRVLEQENITWQSWWDRSVRGPIHEQWNVTMRPCIYIIDAHGVIRHKDVFNDELDAALEALIAETETAQ